MGRTTSQDPNIRILQKQKIMKNLSAFIGISAICCAAMVADHHPMLAFVLLALGAILTIPVCRS